MTDAVAENTTATMFCECKGGLTLYIDATDPPQLPAPCPFLRYPLPTPPLVDSCHRRTVTFRRCTNVDQSTGRRRRISRGGDGTAPAWSSICRRRVTGDRRARPPTPPPRPPRPRPSWTGDRGPDRPGRDGTAVRGPITSGVRAAAGKYSRPDVVVTAAACLKP